MTNIGEVTVNKGMFQLTERRYNGYYLLCGSKRFLHFITHEATLLTTNLTTQITSTTSPTSPTSSKFSHHGGASRQDSSRLFDWLLFPVSYFLVNRSPISRLYAGQQYEMASELTCEEAAIGSVTNNVDEQTQTVLESAISALPGTEEKTLKPSPAPSVVERHEDLSGDSSGRDLANGERTESFTTLKLKADTADLLAEIIRKRKALKSLKQLHEEASQIATVGRAWHGNASAMLEEVSSQEEYDELRREIERRAPDILKDVEHEEHLQVEIYSKSQNLEFSREELEDLQMELYSKSQDPEFPKEEVDGLKETLGRTQSAEEDCLCPTPDFRAGASDRSVVDADDMVWQNSPMTANERESQEFNESVKMAEENLLEAQMDFDSLPDVQRQHKIDYRQKSKEGVYTFYTESELDVSHVIQARQITRALIEAEEAFDKACAAARCRGIFDNDADNTSLDSGYDLSPSGLALANVDFKPASVQAWMDGVPRCADQANSTPDLEADVGTLYDQAWSEESPAKGISQCGVEEEGLAGTWSWVNEYLNPDSDEWDARTVNMSDNLSLTAEDGSRKLINQWVQICESAREGAYDGDAGTMARAVMLGELDLH